MEQPTIPAGWLTLRPFAAQDISWVCEVSRDSAVQHFVQVPTPYGLEHAAFFVEQVAIAGWDSGQRAEFLVAEATSGRRLGRVGLGLGGAGAAEIGYWVDPAARQHGVATHAVRTLCSWAFATLDLEIIEWRTEVANVPSRRVRRRPGSSSRRRCASGRFTAACEWTSGLDHYSERSDRQLSGPRPVPHARWLGLIDAADAADVPASPGVSARSGRGSTRTRTR
jgi:RimJ/RimL family protein N-acetyltransferase